MKIGICTGVIAHWSDLADHRAKAGLETEITQVADKTSLVVDFYCSSHSFTQVLIRQIKNLR